MSELIIFPMDSNYYSGSDILTSNIFMCSKILTFLFHLFWRDKFSTLSQSNWS